MTHWWVAELWELDRVILVSWVFWVIGSIVLHELGHGWAALRAGDRTPIETGHMTWNPVVHLGVPSLFVFALVGLAWGAMPVNRDRFKRRSDEAIVAAAGPAMNFGLAVVCHVLLAVWIGAAGRYWFESFAAPDWLFKNMQTFLRAGGALNLLLLALNLMPVPPLDGSGILGRCRRCLSGCGRAMDRVWSPWCCRWVFCCSDPSRSMPARSARRR